MKISLKRQIVSLQDGDEAVAVIREMKEKGEHLNMQSEVLNNGIPTGIIIYHTFGSYASKGRYFFERFLSAINAPEEDVDLNWFKNKTFTFTAANKEWGGKKYIAINEFLPSQTSTPSAVIQDEPDFFTAKAVAVKTNDEHQEVPDFFTDETVKPKKTLGKSRFVKTVLDVDN